MSRKTVILHGRDQLVCAFLSVGEAKCYSFNIASYPDCRNLYLCDLLDTDKNQETKSFIMTVRWSEVFCKISLFFFSFFFFFLVSIFSERDQNKILLSRDISLTFSLHVKVLLTRKVPSVFLNMNGTPITVTVSLNSVKLTVLNLHTDHGHLKMASMARC